MKKVGFGLLLGLLAIINDTKAQEKWDLRRCVDYAVSNNISIKQSQVQEKLAELQYLQLRDSRWPSLNFNTNQGFQFGRSIDPATNQFTNAPVTFVSGQLQTGVTLFNWFSIKNNIEANRLTVQANKAATEKVKDDISLNVANAYLTALLTYEQSKLAEIVISETTQQLGITRKKVNAGALPELNAAELEAQLARDSATYLVSESNRQLNLLQLKAILNMDASTPFDIATPPVEAIPVEGFAELEPSLVYQLAMNSQPQQISNKYRLASQEYNIKVAKAGLYPTFSGFGSLQSSFSSASKRPKGTPITSVTPTTSFVTVTGSNYFIQVPITRYNEFNTVGFGRQFGDNFRQSLGIGMQVPIFNGHQAKTNWQRSVVNQQNLVLQMQADSLTLKQNIYQAYQGALSAYQTWQGRKKTLETSEYALSLGRKRYDIGLLPTLDLLTLTTNLQRAQIDVLSARFDYVFRMKVLEFYKGRGIKL
ncbi:MAG: TolC family protein [Chitinophagaceae bacterium]